MVYLDSFRVIVNSDCACLATIARYAWGLSFALATPTDSTQSMLMENT